MTELPNVCRPQDDQPRAGLFIAVEGISGCGKTTLVRRLGQELSAATLHTVPEPFGRLSGWVNQHALPLVQLMHYLTGALYASDTIRARLAHGSLVADRYITSVIVNHAAVNGIDVRKVQEVVHPFAAYLARPDLTLYLHTSPTELRRRMAGKPDLSASDRHLLDHPWILGRLVELYERFAKRDPHTAIIETDGLSISEVADAALDAVRRQTC